MAKPLVSVICLSFNQEKYLKQAIESVLDQTYKEVELIVIDDASTDNSRAIIEHLAGIHKFQTIFNRTNLGNCKSFNLGLRRSHGKYLIDLAADDRLLQDRISIGVKELEHRGASFGVHFCDVELQDETGNFISTHFKRDSEGKLLDKIPEGDIYTHLIERYLICAPSMMMSRKVLEELHGYDEELSYEDFDFWIRSSRNYKYAFSDQVLVKKLTLKNSLSSIQYQRKNRHAMSTARVCEKIFALNKSDAEHKALLKRINYELKWALITENWEASGLLLQLKKKLGHKSVRMAIENIALKIKPQWYWVWKMML